MKFDGRLSESLSGDGLTLEMFPIPVCISNLNGDITRANDEFLKLAGKPAELVLGRRVPEALPKINLSVPIDDIIAKVRNDGNFAAEIEIPQSESLKRKFEIRWIRLSSEDDGTAVIFNMFLEVTGKKMEEAELQKRLMRADRLSTIGNLTAGLAHELNNMLAPALLHVGAIKQSKDVATVKAADSLEQVICSASELIKRLIGFVQGYELETRTQKLLPILHDVCGIIRPMLRHEKSLELITPDSMLEVYCDRAQLQHVLINLCINAKEAMDKSGRITMEAKKYSNQVAQQMTVGILNPGKYIEIQVADDGIGMDSNTFERVFEPFYTTKPVGSGLGLTSSLAIVQSHGGLMDITSELGKGSTVSIYLPLAGTNDYELEALP